MGIVARNGRTITIYHLTKDGGSFRGHVVTNGTGVTVYDKNGKNLGYYPSWLAGLSMLEESK